MYRWALALLCVVACGAVLKPAEPNRRLGDSVESVSKLTLRPFHLFMVRELTSADQVLGAFGNADAVEAAHSTALAR